MVCELARRSAWLPSHPQVQGGLLTVMGCALIVAPSRDVPPSARAAGQLGVMLAWGAMALLHLGAWVAGRAAV